MALQPLPQQGLAIYVFSHNRGEFLDVALASCERNAAGIPTYIVDDSSDCPVTRSVIEKWSCRTVSSVELLDAESILDPASKRGGLHANMERALVHAREQGHVFALMLQDDMQIVRAIDEFDLQSVVSYFDANARSQGLHVTFSPMHSPMKRDLWEVDTSRTAVFPVSGNRVCSHYSDVDLFRVDRYFEYFSTLSQSEQENSQRAQSLGLVRGLYLAPFLMFLPYPRTCANRPSMSRRGAMLCALAEMLNGAGVHPFVDMESSEVVALRSRQVLDPPRAREWLRCPSVDHLERWSYYGGLRDLRARGGFRSQFAVLFRAQRPQK